MQARNRDTGLLNVRLRTLLVSGKCPDFALRPGVRVAMHFADSTELGSP